MLYEQSSFNRLKAEVICERWLTEESNVVFILLGFVLGNCSVVSLLRCDCLRLHGQVLSLKSRIPLPDSHERVYLLHLFMSMDGIRARLGQKLGLIEDFFNF